jgi:hypothetical protein
MQTKPLLQAPLQTFIKFLQANFLEFIIKIGAIQTFNQG